MSRSKEYKQRQAERKRQIRAAWTPEQREADLKWHREYAERTRARRRQYMADYYQARQVMINIHKDVPCMDCGVKYDPVCMDFDHRPGTGKRFNIAQHKYAKLDTILEEIEKCDVVCANCHRLRTKNRRISGSASASSHLVSEQSSVKLPEYSTLSGGAAS